MKIGDKVWHIRINKPTDGVKTYSREEGVHIKELEILGMNDFKLVLNDDWFTTFDILNGRKETYKSYLDNTIVTISTGEKYFSNGVFITLYSTKKPNKRILDKMVATACVEIDKKYGFLFGGIKEEIYKIVDDVTL